MKDSLNNFISAVVCGLLALGFTAEVIYQAINRSESCILFFLLAWLFWSWTRDCIRELRKHYHFNT